MESVSESSAFSLAWAERILPPFANVLTSRLGFHRITVLRLFCSTMAPIRRYLPHAKSTSKADTLFHRKTLQSSAEANARSVLEGSLSSHAPMERTPKFHLVDQSGRPLDERFGTVVRQLEREFFERFRQVRDPAVIANCVEEAALRVHVHETKRGRVENLRPFFLRVYCNIVKSLLRGPYHTKHEANVPDRELEDRGRFSSTGTAEQTERWLIAREAIERLDEGKQELLRLNALGYNAKEIARKLHTSENNVYTMLHRAREEAKQILNSKRPDQS